VRERPRRPGVRRRTDSYPSGHTTGATALALTMAFVLQRHRAMSPRAAMAMAAGVPMLMGSYRVIADDHWATDVFGGWMLGGAIGLTCNAVLADSVRPRRPRSSGREARA
jgi:membrane-associated phospholipid phosphatase